MRTVRSGPQEDEVHPPPQDHGNGGHVFRGLAGDQWTSEAEIQLLRGGLANAEQVVEAQRHELEALANKTKCLQAQLDASLAKHEGAQQQLSKAAVERESLSDQLREEHASVQRLFEQHEAVQLDQSGAVGRGGSPPAADPSPKEASSRLAAAEAERDILAQAMKQERRRSRDLETQLEAIALQRDAVLRAQADAAVEAQERLENLETSRAELVQCLKYKHDSARQLRERLARAEAQLDEESASSSPRSRRPQQQQRQRCGPPTPRAGARAAGEGRGFADWEAAEPGGPRLLPEIPQFLEARPPQLQHGVARAVAVEEDQLHELRQEVAEERARTRCLEEIQQRTLGVECREIAALERWQGCEGRMLAQAREELAAAVSERDEIARSVDLGRTADKRARRRFELFEEEHDAVLAHLVVTQAERDELGQSLKQDRERIRCLTSMVEAVTAEKEQAGLEEARHSDVVRVVRVEAERDQLQRKSMQDNGQMLRSRAELERELSSSDAQQTPQQMPNPVAGADCAVHELRASLQHKQRRARSLQAQLKVLGIGHDDAVAQDEDVVCVFSELQQRVVAVEDQRDKLLESLRQDKIRLLQLQMQQEMAVAECEAAIRLKQSDVVIDHAIQEMQRQLAVGDIERDELRESLKLECHKHQLLMMESEEMRDQCDAMEGEQEQLMVSFREERQQTERLRMQLGSLGARAAVGLELPAQERHDPKESRQFELQRRLELEREAAASLQFRLEAIASEGNADRVAWDYQLTLAEMQERIAASEAAQVELLQILAAERAGSHCLRAQLSLMTQAHSDIASRYGLQEGLYVRADHQLGALQSCLRWSGH